MVNYQTQHLDHTFSALADPTRRAILQRLTRGPATVGELRKPFSMSAPAISKHLRILEQAGLMERQKKGRTHWCSLGPSPLANAEEWIHKQRTLWNGLLDSLEIFLEENPK